MHLHNKFTPSDFATPEELSIHQFLDNLGLDQINVQQWVDNKKSECKSLNLAKALNEQKSKSFYGRRMESVGSLSSSPIKPRLNMRGTMSIVSNKSCSSHGLSNNECNNKLKLFEAMLEAQTKFSNSAVAPLLNQ